MKSCTILWLRNDLRLADQPALRAAVDRGGAVVPVFIWQPQEEGAWSPGAASRWWLHQSLLKLSAELRLKGAELVIRQGPALEVLTELVRETGAQRVYWNRRYEPAVIERDRRVKEGLREAGIEAQSYNGTLLREPWEVKNKNGKPFQVFTPFYKACLAMTPPEHPIPSPNALQPIDQPVKSLALDALGLEPKLKWADRFNEVWHPGESGARKTLEHFFQESIADYDVLRNRPDLLGTSRLSPHLHFGEISPREVWDAARTYAEAKQVPADVWRNWQFLKELGWREFAHHLLYHFPHTPDSPLRTEFTRFPWRENVDGLGRWQRGCTGYPLVDAGMRELWHTGWMHNRVRMVVASFLVKDLLVKWQDGARWFWDTLVDANLANNTLGWQWTAGCGADAAPYFRVFNPVTQGVQFDPEAIYIRRWVPELARLETRWIHRPWEAPASALDKAGIALGRDYPEPVVSHAIAREIALQAYEKVKRPGSVLPGRLKVRISN